MASPPAPVNVDPSSTPSQKIYVIVLVGRTPGLFIKGQRRLSDSIAFLRIAKIRLYDTEDEARLAFLQALANGRVAKVSETATRHRVPSLSYPPSPSDSELTITRPRPSGRAWVVFEGRDTGVFSHLSRRSVRNVPGVRYQQYAEWADGLREFSRALDAGEVFHVVMHPVKTILQNTPNDLLLCAW